MRPLYLGELPANHGQTASYSLSFAPAKAQEGSGRAPRLPLAGIICPAMSFAAGTRLENYQILGLLGAGGMGEVYRALDPVLKREVAIKVLPASFSRDLNRLGRFEQEAQAAAALNHPGILAVHHFGSFQGVPYLVTELLEGETLRRHLEQGAIPIRKAIEYGVQIARGLAAAHEKGIVHRDLKPENLFVTRDGRMKILDFGLAKFIQRPTYSDGNTSPVTHLTDPGVLVGTVGYMSPEQVREKSVDYRADIFALGAILYEMLSGLRAFHRATTVETMNAILHDDLPNISSAASNIPQGLQRIARRCLEKNPDQCFQSASDLAFALEALSETETVSPLAGALPKLRKRKWLPWVAIAATVAAAAVVLFAVVTQNAGGKPRVMEYIQITHSGDAGQVWGTDGARLYLNRGAYGIAEVAASGGDIAPVQIDLPNPFLMDVSQDGSTFLVGSAKAGIGMSIPIWSVNILGASHQYLASGVEAAWSPDGTQVAYLTRDGTLNVVGSDGTGTHKIASFGEEAWSPSWSPDAKAIRFSKESGLWEISVTGTGLRHLFSVQKGDTCCGHWSADGNTFYFNSKGQILARDERRSFFHKQSPPVQITSEPLQWGQPIPSKDGKKLFVRGASARGELIRFDANTRQFQPYLGGISADNIAFSKDGLSFVYVTYPDCVLWRASVDGSRKVKLTSPPVCPWLPRWSPDGTQISFVDVDALNGLSYLVDSDGGKLRPLLEGDKGPETDPTWSADGSRIVFSTRCWT
jgi:WD40 repeat protein